MLVRPLNPRNEHLYFTTVCWVLYENIQMLKECLLAHCGTLTNLLILLLQGCCHTPTSSSRNRGRKRRSRNSPLPCQLLLLALQSKSDEGLCSANPRVRPFSCSPLFQGSLLTRQSRFRKAKWRQLGKSRPVHSCFKQWWKLARPMGGNTSLTNKGCCWEL